MTSLDAEAAPVTDRLLVLVTGTGRSGTSTMSGTLHHLGLHVPGPHLGANESNPKGFFESRWAVRFHNAISNRAAVSIYDSRPEAFDLVQSAVTATDREKLAKFLARISAEHDQVVVKDPRTVWTQGLWRDVAREQGLGIRYVSMLRHPAEVAGSRTTYYSGTAGADAGSASLERKRFAVLNVARWINGSLISERETRGQTRAFVHYPDLLADWRPVMAALQEDLGLHYDLTDGGAGVDDFIEPGLRRHQVTWDDLEVPDHLVRIADDVWTELRLLGQRNGVDAGASQRLDLLADAYATALVDAGAMAQDLTSDLVRRARRDGADAAIADRGPLVAETGGRDLLAELRHRAVARLRR